jgi:pimeloyl-ACP methyl ester carboxylesterase
MTRSRPTRRRPPRPPRLEPDLTVAMTTASQPARTRAVPVGRVSISFREAGDPAGPAAVLLHGGASSSATWDRLNAALAAAGYHVIAADLRGHGGSSRTGAYPLSAYSDDIRGLMDTLAIRSAALVGHSLGGYAASVLAQRDPDRVSRLILEEPGIPGRDTEGGNELGPRFLLAALAGLATHSGYDRRAVASAVRQLRIPDPAWWDRLPLITAPTLLISGGPASHIRPQHLAEAARSIPRCSFVTILAGHRVHSRRPDQFLAAVIPFLTERIVKGAQLAE